MSMIRQDGSVPGSVHPAVLCLEEGAGFVLFNPRRDQELPSSFLCLNRYKNDYLFPSLKAKGWEITAMQQENPARAALVHQGSTSTCLQAKILGPAWHSMLHFSHPG